jgi:hypothetical protein
MTKSKRFLATYSGTADQGQIIHVPGGILDSGMMLAGIAKL